MINLKEKINSLPQLPGVYLMRGCGGKVIYVGKANNLRKRLSSYLGQGLSAKTGALMRNVTGIDYRVTPTETMALLLEASLVHELKPKYNILLRDDKSFPYLGITREDFPRVYLRRKKDDIPARLFGPYTSANLLKQAFKVIRRILPYRSCRVLPKQPCIYHKINLCPAPCAGRISKKDYAQVIKKIILILGGSVDVLIKMLTKTMREKSQKLDFEAAALIRDQIGAIGAIGDNPAEIGGLHPGLEGLKGLLGLGKVPARIEGYDLSNIAGQAAVGSLVSFFNGQPDKNNYRRFRIKGLGGIDDYRMLREVLRRRFSRLIREKSLLPDLLLIDGGRAHLLAADSELKQLGVNVPLISIAKTRENIYISKNPKPIKFSSDTATLNLIRRIRDEAHRFALSYHHLLRRKGVLGR